MSTDDGDEIIVSVLRDILGKLGDIHGAIDRLGIRVMSVNAAAGRIESHADAVAVDLAWSHLEAAKVAPDAPAGARADAAVQPTPTERWEA